MLNVSNEVDLFEERHLEATIRRTRRNAVRPQVFQVFACALQKTVHLVTLNLSRHYLLGNTGISILAEGLRKNVSIKQLTLRNVGIGREG
jgi:Ran GTPase-activating protein (RanGAP) involved in mRNA processing and transport